jgi:hypothetical protein
MRRSMRVAAVAVLALLVQLAPLSAGAQGGPGDPRLAARFGGEALARLQAVLDSARVADLPTEALVQRALEGASRRLPPERVVGAVSALAGRMRTSRALLGSKATEADLLAAASALHAGIDQGTLARLARSRGGTGVALPLIVLVDIVERGVPQDTAKRVILALADPRIGDADFQALRQSILGDIGSGAPAGAAATTRARGLLVAHGLAAPVP